jgi:rod shape-determining protein MreD
VIRQALGIGAIVFVAALLQVSIFTSIDVLGGEPDVLLVTLLAVAMLRGSLAGAIAGFGAGLILDVAHLGTPGVTALLLTFAGYWSGRYGETTGRDRVHAPIAAIVVLTALVQVGGYALRFLLGEDVAADRVFAGLLPAIGLNLLIGAPVFALVRLLLRPFDPPERVREVQLLG